MGITYFDILFLGVILISSMLAMARGIFSELISLTNWIGTAMITYYIYPFFLRLMSKYFVNKQIAIISTIIPLFMVILIVISILLKIVTTPIHIKSVFLDKILGFIFGSARGLILLIIATSFWNLLVNDSKEPEWIQNAKSKKMLDTMAFKLKSHPHNHTSITKQIGSNL